LDNLTEKTEKSLLMKLHLAVWATLSVAVMATVGSIVFLVVQYSQSSEIPKPESRRLEASVKADDFLKQFASTRDFSTVKIFEDEVSQSTQVRVKAKYLDEAKKIVACSRDSNSKSGLDISAFTPQLAETFQHELQRVADSQPEQRGVTYVADAVRFFCEVMTKAEVIAYKKNNSEMQLFDAVINYHLTQWDRVKQDSVRFGQAEQQRILNAISTENLRVANMQSRAFAAVCIAGGSLGLLMATALYFVLARVELAVQRVYQIVEALNLNVVEQSSHSEFSKLPLQHPTPDAPVVDSIVQDA
jgi:hypothetical protein